MFAPHDHMIIQFCALLSIIIRVTINHQLATEITIVTVLSSMSCPRCNFFMDLIKFPWIWLLPISICFIPSLIGFIGSKRPSREGWQRAILTVTVALITSIQLQYLQGFSWKIFLLPILISPSMEWGRGYADNVTPGTAWKQTLKLFL